MRRKSFRLPCRTISERSGRRSGHSPPPPPDRRIAQQYAAKPAKLIPPHGTCIASYDTSPRPTTAAPPRRAVPRLTAAPTIQHSRSSPLHRNAHRPAVPHGVAAMPHDRRCTTFRQPADGISRRPSRTAAAFFPKQNRIRGTLSRKNGYLCRAKVSEVSSGLRESIGNAVQFGDSTCCCEFRSSRQGEDDSATHSH